MLRAHLVVETAISRSARARQLEGMFDVPPAEVSRIEYTHELPLDERDWQVGLVVGPSGSGKTQLARHLWPDHIAEDRFTWNNDSVVDDFRADLKMSDIAAVCGAVGFNTIPAWLRPYRVLSNGEQFRASLARTLIESDGLAVVDEFTSVVDRQVAKIGSHAVQKWVRRHADRQFVAVTCHYDVTDWLQPDWIYDVATGEFQWRSVQRRPDIDVVSSPVPNTAWRLFSRYHYLTASLHRSARCFVAFVNGEPAAFTSIMYRPVSRPTPGQRPLVALHRTVTLPDYQGLGLAPHLTDQIAAWFKAIGVRLRSYPAHPHYVRMRDKSPHWRCIKRPGSFAGSARTRREQRRRSAQAGLAAAWMQTAGSRPNGVFEYCGPAADEAEARRVLAAWPTAFWNRRRQSAQARP